MKLPFLRLFDNPVLKYLTFNVIFCMQLSVLGYLPKLKGGLGLAFAAHFQPNFSIKVFFI